MKKMTVLISFVFPLAMAFPLGGIAMQNPGAEADAGRKLNPAAAVVSVQSRFELGADAHTGTLLVTADVQEGYHIYAATQPKPFVATEIHVEPGAPFELAGPFTADQSPAVRVHEALEVELHEHEGRITWSAPLRLEPSARPQTMTISGYLYAQACTTSRCLAPRKYPFVARLAAGPEPGAAHNTPESSRGRVPARAGASGTAQTTGENFAAEAPDSNEIAGSASSQPIPGGRSNSLGLAAALGFGFLAGLILNVMPCVLPVVSLKIYGFIKEAGSDPRHVRRLGLSFAAGIVTVFLVLASLAAFAGLGWGQQFQSDRFLVLMIALMVVFALGMFEVYIVGVPAFLGRIQPAGRGGAAGAFTTGMIATLLATPCSGPFLGATLSYSLTQPPGVIFAVFSTIGMGMAFPYVLLSWHPGWLRALPRPGEWMNTAKGVMGFFLLGTAAWLLWQRRSNGSLVVWTVVFCLFVALGLWLYGRWTGPLASTGRRRAAPALAAALVALGGWFSFGPTFDVPAAAAVSPAASADPLALWQPFSRARLEALRAQGRTVVVDWTADWCLTCKTLEKLVLHTDEVTNALRAQGAVALKADLTQDDPEAQALLRELGNTAHSIPFLAVFCADRPQQPAVLADWFAKDDLLKILAQCSPQVNPPAPARAETQTVSHDKPGTY